MACLKSATTAAIMRHASGVGSRARLPQRIAWPNGGFIVRESPREARPFYFFLGFTYFHLPFLTSLAHTCNFVHACTTREHTLALIQSRSISRARMVARQEWGGTGGRTNASLHGGYIVRDGPREARLFYFLRMFLLFTSSSLHSHSRGIGPKTTAPLA
ncbi:hypothetical protein B0H14DRAFT_3521538 [Mycena olivaceomarginata]|nr:hypothetical protein B0H14DRAFT_3521538 [Mycena olivaceomarginata]